MAKKRVRYKHGLFLKEKKISTEFRKNQFTRPCNDRGTVRNEERKQENYLRVNYVNAGPSSESRSLLYYKMFKA